MWQSPQGHVVRIPISVKFAEFVAPPYIKPALRAPAFEQRIKIGTDAATTVTINSLGAKAADVTQVLVTRQPTSLTPNLNATGVGKVDITVPQGVTYLAVALFDEDVSKGVDLDLYLYRGNTPMASSTAVGSTEMLEATKGIEPGTYTAYIYPYETPTESATAYLHVWMLPATSADNVMKVTPSFVTTSPGDMSCCPITLSFNGLEFSSRGKR